MMGTGQMLLTIAAMMLLGSVMLTTNRGMNTSSQTLLETNCGLDAVSLATSVIQQAEALPFDESTIAGVDTLLTQLSTTLGPEGGETTPDDFDDYNGRLDSVTNMSTGIYYIRTQVFYVGNATNLMQNSLTRQWTKRMDVRVWNKDLPDTVVMHSIYSYWFFGRGGRP